MREQINSTLSSCAEKCMQRGTKIYRVLLPAAMAQIQYEVNVSMDFAPLIPFPEQKAQNFLVLNFCCFWKYNFHRSYQVNCIYPNRRHAKCYTMTRIKGHACGTPIKRNEDGEGEWEEKAHGFGWVFCVLLFWLPCNRVIHVFWVVSQANSDN